VIGSFAVGSVPVVKYLYFGCGIIDELVRVFYNVIENAGIACFFNFPINE
jgi:hypothetical protein